MRDELSKFEEAGVQPLGVNPASVDAHARYAAKMHFNFPLLSDWGGEVTKEYGIYNPQYKAARRVTFLIDKEGKIVEMQKDSEAVDPTAVVTSCERRKLKG